MDSPGSNVESFNSRPHFPDWVDASDGDYPNFAVSAGIDSESEVFIICAQHEDQCNTGKLIATQPKAKAYIPHEGKEITVSSYKVLTAAPATLNWIAVSGTEYPRYSFTAVCNLEGDFVVGRVIHEGQIAVGRVDKNEGLCYYTYGGNELSSAKYEVLVENNYSRELRLQFVKNCLN